jgi:hypothetical protein
LRQAGSPGLSRVDSAVEGPISVATDTSQHSGTANVVTNAEETSLEAEIASLSLDAGADRFLGSSSGVSFARLTQAVLRRLGPDHRPFEGANATSTDFPSSRGVQESACTTPDDTWSLPTKERAFELANFYWAHNHLLYPFLRKAWFMEMLTMTYSGQDYALYENSSWLYTMFMVLAIGSTSHASIVLTALEIESAKLYKQAMLHFDAALSIAGTYALDSMLLQISYSFFNRVGPNTWYLVGSAIRLAIGMGLHAPNPTAQQLPLEIQEHRKRIFWSLYMADRVVSMSLGRPMAIRDDDIEVQFFSTEVNAALSPGTTLSHPSLAGSDLAVPSHILALRRIGGQIFDQVYSARRQTFSNGNENHILAGLHTQLLEWRRTIPFPLPRCQYLQVPHTST